MEPRCRKCGTTANEVAFFQDCAEEHNAPEAGNDLIVTARTFAYGPGSNYDPSTNSFICPECQGGTNVIPEVTNKDQDV